MTENEYSSKIIGACIEVHRQLGPGLLGTVFHRGGAKDAEGIYLCGSVFLAKV